MNATEMARCLGSRLKGSRSRAFKVELRTARRSGKPTDDPESVYRTMKERLLEFKEGIGKSSSN